MRFNRLALVPLFAFMTVACSPGSTAAPAGTSPGSSAAPTAADPSATAVTRIEVKLTDSLRIEPAEMNVPVGVPVTFVITNQGALEHEFYLGDEQAQAKHEQEMQSMGGMIHDEPEGIAVEPGETKELTFTFASAGDTLAGCHVAGHYVAGMKATIKVGA